MTEVHQPDPLNDVVEAMAVGQEPETAKPHVTPFQRGLDLSWRRNESGGWTKTSAEGEVTWVGDGEMTAFEKAQRTAADGKDALRGVKMPERLDRLVAARRLADVASILNDPVHGRGGP